MRRARAVLFDLDGTLVDTAPDLGYAANQVRAHAGLPPLPAACYRPVASAGARGLLQVALNLTPDQADYSAKRELFLTSYQDNLSRESRLFPGMEQALAEFERRRIPWGVVTNKPEWLATPLLKNLNLRERMACMIGAREGLPMKPAPDSLLLAAKELGLAPADCVYVGDDRRDIVAARAAGMPVVAVAWGYLGANENVEDWRADSILATPADLLQLI